MAKIKVKIAVVVNSEGGWNSFGFKGGIDSEMMDNALDGMGEKIGSEATYWLTAELDMPIATEISASVEKADG